MQITVNGETEIIDPCTIDEFIRKKDLNPEAVVVERNHEIVKRQHWGEIQLQEDDTLELLSFVGGG